jgi:hypothetical protein
MLSITACSTDPTYVYRAKPFDASTGCLGVTVSLDVIEGPIPSECPPVCLVQANADGGKAVYVSRTCAPYPPQLDSTGTAPECSRALIAAAEANGCVPPVGVDAGAPDAPLDAADGGDAALDASDASDAQSADGAGPSDASLDAADAAD